MIPTRSGGFGVQAANRTRSAETEIVHEMGRIIHGLDGTFMRPPSHIPMLDTRSMLVSVPCEVKLEISNVEPQW